MTSDDIMAAFCLVILGCLAATILMLTVAFAGWIWTEFKSYRRRNGY